MTVTAKLGGWAWSAIAAAAGLVTFLIYREYFAAGGTSDGHAAPVPAVAACLPFLVLLGAIAVLPLLPATAHWWESNLHRLRVSLALGAATLAYYAVAEGPASVPTVLQHAVLHEYLPFIVLLFSLYVISGGISLQGDLPAHPATNTAFLAVGSVLASVIGTTGASMLLIRPVLQTNRERKHVTHTVIFFIFLVSNIGGSLLPIGDPPLFLGYLKGVPFLWTLQLLLPWALTTALLLIVYYLADRVAYARETIADVRVDEMAREQLSLRGRVNLLYLLGIVACVGTIDPAKDFLGLGLFTPFAFLRELLMLALVVASLRTTPKGVRERNRFTYAPILEVAALFIGIFVCMQPPIALLHARGASVGLSEPWHFFWATGLLSSLLDNAPTYVVFFETAKTLPAVQNAVHLSGGGVIAEPLLEAISVGAVFMGAMTYIGNGPNFMVKSIAEQSGVRMPSFFGYTLWSAGILLPVFGLLTWLFFVKA